MMPLMVAYFSLVLARVGAFVGVLPLLGGRQLPRTVKVGLTLALTALWGTTFMDRLPAAEWLVRPGVAPWLGYGFAVAREAMLGAVLGFTFGLFLVPARVAGEYLSQEMGLTFGNQISATGDGLGTPLTVILEMIAGAIFLGLDGHHAFFGVLHGTFEHYPVGQGLPKVPLESVIGAVAATEEWGLMLAAPVALCLFLTTVVLTLMARATPQLNLYSVGFPLRLGVGLIALLLLLPHGVATMISIFGHVGDLMCRVL